jgi:hypothetical protein
MFGNLRSALFLCHCPASSTGPSANLFAEKPYPTAKGIQTRRADARKTSPAQFIQMRIIEKLDKQGFIDGLYQR